MLKFMELVLLLFEDGVWLNVFIDYLEKWILSNFDLTVRGCAIAYLKEKKGSTYVEDYLICYRELHYRIEKEIFEDWTNFAIPHKKHRKEILSTYAIGEVIFRTLP